MHNLNQGEKIILKSQGTLYIKHSNSWRGSYLFLTNKRIFFTVGLNRPFETYLSEITNITIEKREWILGVRIRQLCIYFNSKKGEERAYIALAQPVKWRRNINESMALMLAEGCGYNGTVTKSTSNA